MSSHMFKKDSQKYFPHHKGMSVMLSGNTFRKTNNQQKKNKKNIPVPQTFTTMHKAEDFYGIWEIPSSACVGLPT